MDYAPAVFLFSGAPVPVRSDLGEAFSVLWDHFASPGPSLTGEQRITLLASTRSNDPSESTRAGFDATVITLAATLFHTPAAVDERLVRASADRAGDPATVEVIGLVSMLSAVDGFHNALATPLEALPDPRSGEPTGRIRSGLERRRTHIPVPPGPIPVVLDLLPDEGLAFRESFGPQYMTDDEMHADRFFREPGLDRAQMELISSRTSIINECFY